MWEAVLKETCVTQWYTGWIINICKYLYSLHTDIVHKDTKLYECMSKDDYFIHYNMKSGDEWVLYMSQI